MKESAKSEHPGTLTSTISAIVVDDEPLARQELAFLLKAHSDIHVVAEARNGLEALQLIKEHEPDVVFVDVAMPGLDGMGLVRKLLEKKGKVKMPHVVFATAYDQYAVQAFELNAVDYLLKPIDKGRLAQSVQRVRRMMESQAPSPAEALEDVLRALQGRTPQQSKLLLRTNNRLFLIDAQDLIYATIEGGLITLVTREMEGESNYRTLEDLQANLDPNAFWRVHRS
ncbi:MAG: response regulator, partial [Acidobacteria bacterium]|nr:response regulator [Acidobacteriota bacterium]